MKKRLWIIIEILFIISVAVLPSRALAVQPMVAAGKNFTVGLKSDGTVVATGYNRYGQLDVTQWTDIDQVAAGERHTVGLKTDGTVETTDDAIDVTQWTGIVQVATGYGHVVGLKKDGTVVAAGTNASGQSQLCDWRLMVE